MRGIIWFKKDLRLHDHPALYHACTQCTEGLVAIYFLDCDMWKKHDTSHCQIEFILRGLEKLQLDLDKIGIPLLIENIHTQAIPHHLLTLAHNIQAKTLFFNQELELDEARRDSKVINFLESHAITCQTYADQFILPASDIRTQQGDFFKVFTPFKRKWIEVLQHSSEIKLFPKSKAKIRINMNSSTIPKKLSGIQSKIDPMLWPAGEDAARRQLQQFIKQKLFHYHKERDFPALQSTSQLSPYLAVGMISIRECFLAAKTANANEVDTGNKGAITWISELIWREFYRHILLSAPRVCMHKPFKTLTEKLPWKYDKKLLQAWQEGNTGFPLIDAGMRQLNTTGWMHNRLRMVTAMFLSKILFLDWRLGEKYFAQHLIDFDFASNNGGWQWCASTGTDAVPYFRIFNPASQTKRFDSQGKFIQQFCPEIFENSHYPKPIVDYAGSRQRVIQAFKHLSKI